MSLLEQAKSGYTNMGQFESAFYGLYDNPEAQRKFGVEDLAYMNAKPSSILNHMMTDNKVSEGSINFNPDRLEPPIEGGVFVRNRSMFSKDTGKFVDPPIDADGKMNEELNKLRQMQERNIATQRVLVEREAKALAMREADMIPATDLKRWAQRTMDMAGMVGRYKDKEELKKAGYALTSTELFNLPAKEAREYIIDRFFGNDPEALIAWKETTGADGGKRVFPDPRRDLFAEEFAGMEAVAEAEDDEEEDESQSRFVEQPADEASGSGE
tara:strand:- start:2868 stop:3677 length:810 start_codon:yes stop_codon:yes gene_type:complete